jgi:hypothetical protein
MKNTFLAFLLAGITFLGCNNNVDNTVVSSHTNNDILTKSSLSASKLIDGASGDQLILDNSYIDSEGRQINVYARLLIPPGSYQGTINIEMVTNDEDVSIQLFPEMTFAGDVKLDLVFTGIDLQALGYTTSGNVEFAYFADNGDVELIENDLSLVNISQNKISVSNAKLNHFSRYSWIR